MKVKQLFEAPLGDYKYIGKEKGKWITPKAELTSDEFKGRVSHVFAGVKLRVNIYLLGDSRGTPSLNPKHNHFKNSVNPNFYRQTTKPQLRKAYGLTDEVSVDNKSIAIVFTSNDEFPLSPWAIAHDTVHAITVTMPSSNAKLDEIERQLTIMIGKYVEPLGVAPRDVLKSLWKLGTMKSSEGDTHQDIGEFTTELMTQWLVSKKVTLDVDRLAKSFDMPRSHAEYMEEELEEYVETMEKAFAEIVDRAKGKIFITSA